MKDQLTGGIDVRKIDVNKYPAPPAGYVWQISLSHLELVDKDDPDDFYVRYDVPGGYIMSHAPKEVVAFFIDAVRSMCAMMMGPEPPIKVEE